MTQTTGVNLDSTGASPEAKEILKQLSLSALEHPRMFNVMLHRYESTAKMSEQIKTNKVAGSRSESEKDRQMQFLNTRYFIATGFFPDQRALV